MPIAGDIAIIGAGLGGLTAALALMDEGFHVRVYEQARVLGEVGAGISLSPGAGTALATFGLGPALLAASLPVPDIAFVHYKTNQLLAGAFDKTTPPDFGFAKSRHIYRADLHTILLNAVRARDPDAVLVNHRLVALNDQAGRVTAHFANGAQATAEALIGADGVRSAVRHLIIGDDAPDFAGQIAFRCLIPRAAAAPYMGDGNAVVATGAARIFNRYVIRNGDLVNVIGIARSDSWQQEGWSTPATVEEFRALFHDFHPDVLGLIAQAPPDTLIKWGLFVREPLPHWSRGRVLLIGDAAHPMLPFLGLGAATAIEDGIMLARVLRRGLDFEAAFNLFQQARAARVEAVRMGSILQGQIIQSADPDRDGMSQSPSQNPDLFTYDPLAAPI
jgi:salicylate hydroxylase